MNIGALPRRCRPFSLTERSVCFILEAPFLGNAEQGMTSLSANDANVVFCSPKTEGFMIGYLSMTQREHGYFCVGMTSLPTDDAREIYFYLVRSEPHSSCYACETVKWDG